MKAYLLIISAFVVQTLQAQQNNNEAKYALSFPRPVVVNNLNNPNVQPQPKALIWSEDFDLGTISPNVTLGPTFTTANGTWTTGATNGDIWKHSYLGTSGEWSAGAINLNSTSVDNGYMLFDADSVNYPNSPNYTAFIGELISPAIDLTNETSTILNWEQETRHCCSGAHSVYVSVSSDNGVTWGPLHPVAAGQGPSDTFYYINGNSYKTSLNISSEAAGNTVLIKFLWDGTIPMNNNTHYFWEIDDVSITTLPDHELSLTKAWFIGENNEGIQYGRTPINQMDDNYYVGSSITNEGALDQTNLVWDATNGITSNGTHSVLAPLNSISIENLDPITLSPAIYTVDYSVISDGENSSSPTFGNNSATIEFEITPYPAQAIYSQDGIGVYSNPTVSSIGTNSFTGGEDGLNCAVLYHLKQGPLPNGMIVLLGAGTVPGAEVFGFVHDTATYLASDMTALAATVPKTITATDISNGYIDLCFFGELTLPPSSYYFSVELYSAGNTYDIDIIDDLTVEQPAYASAIYIPGDQTYTNGNAFGIQLIFNNCLIGLQENDMTNVTISPNPSSGVIVISDENSESYNVSVRDMLGKIILAEQMKSELKVDLSQYGSGIYLVEITNDHGKKIERIIIE